MDEQLSLNKFQNFCLKKEKGKRKNIKIIFKTFFMWKIMCMLQKWYGIVCINCYITFLFFFMLLHFEYFISNKNSQ